LNLRDYVMVWKDWKVSAGLGVALLAGGCGGTAEDQGGSLTPEAFAAKVDAILEEEGKSDNPTPGRAFIVGDVAPGVVVSHEVSPAQPIVAWTFRAEATAAVNANAALRPVTPVPAPPVAPPRPPVGGGDTANLLIYRRTSCLGRWDRLQNASNSAIMMATLPSAGEYLLVSGATNPNATATLSASFAADNTGKIVTEANPRPEKLGGASSWMPIDAMSKLKTSGLRSFADISKKGIVNVARSTGLSTAVVTELSKLASWLDVDGVTYPQACTLLRAGVADQNGYYSLPYAKQRALAPVVPIGGINYSCGSAANCTCVNLETPPSYQASPLNGSDAPPFPGGDGFRRPVVDWTCYRSNCGCDNPSQPGCVRISATGNKRVIDNRPWTTNSAITGAAVTRPENIDKRWYPNPAEGWDVITYNFGADAGTANQPDVGYLLVGNRFSGVMRLFVWMPYMSPGQSELAVNIGVIGGPNDTPVGWVFPIEDRPPNDPKAHGQEMTLIWKDGARDFQSITAGNWLRAEFGVLYAPDVYSDESARPVRIRLRFKGTKTGETKAFANLTLEANGMAVSTKSGDGLSLLKNVGLGGLSYGSGAQGIFSNPWATGGAIAAGMLFNAFAPNQPEQYRMNISGIVQGWISGTLRVDEPIGKADVFVTGASNGLDGANALTSQRCRSAKIGTIQFNTQDPRPETIPYVMNRCISPSRPILGAIGCVNANTPRPVTVDAGWLTTQLPWAQVSNVRVTLETKYYDELRRDVSMHTPDPTCPLCTGPHVKWATEANRFGGGSIELKPIVLSYALNEQLDPLLGGGPRNINGTNGLFNDMVGDDRYEHDFTCTMTDNRVVPCYFRVYLRWYAQIRPRQPNAQPINWSYALDVTDKLQPIRDCRLETRGALTTCEDQ